MKKQNILQKTAGVFIAALLLAVGVWALPGIATQTAFAAVDPGVAVGLLDEDGDLDGENEDGDHDDDDFGRGFGRRGGNLFRILFILVPVFLVLGLASLGWFFARRRKAATQVAANGPPLPTPVESESEDEA